MHERDAKRIKVWEWIWKNWIEEIKSVLQILLRFIVDGNGAAAAAGAVPNTIFIEF